MKNKVKTPTKFCCCFKIYGYCLHISLVIFFVYKSIIFWFEDIKILFAFNSTISSKHIYTISGRFFFEIFCENFFGNKKEVTSNFERIVYGSMAETL